MIFHALRPLTALLFLAFLAGCISVNLSQESLESADEVRFIPPGNPFEEIASKAADRSWRNPKNGNTITYVSECGDVGRVNLKEVAKTLMKVQNLEVSSQTEVTHNGVKAVVSRGAQQDHSKTVAVELLTFKMNQCLFNLAYLGLEKDLTSNRSVFEKFKENFKGL